MDAKGHLGIAQDSIAFASGKEIQTPERFSKKTRWNIARGLRAYRWFGGSHAFERCCSTEAVENEMASPLVRFNKSGTLLAVAVNHNKFKILAIRFGHELLQTSENISVNDFTILSEYLTKLAINPISIAASN